MILSRRDETERRVAHDTNVAARPTPANKLFAPRATHPGGADMDCHFDNHPTETLRGWARASAFPAPRSTGSYQRVGIVHYHSELLALSWQV